MNVHGLFFTFQSKTPGMEDPHRTGVGMSLPSQAGNRTLQRFRVSSSDRAVATPSSVVNAWPAAGTPAMKECGCSVLGLGWEPV